MAKMLRQVLLRRPRGESGYMDDVVWIDDELAHKGKRVQDEDGIVWVVKETYNAKPFEDVDKQREVWKRFSDILRGH